MYRTKRLNMRRSKLKVQYSKTMKKTLNGLITTLVGTAIIFTSFGASIALGATNSAIPLCEITRNLYVGTSREDVRCLQRYLNFSGYTVASFGPGSPGNETAYFGNLTAQAVMGWQNSNSGQVLIPLGLSSGTGYWGQASFNHYVALVRIALGV